MESTKRSGGNQKVKKGVDQRLLPSAALSLAVCFMLLLYAPLEIYCNNHTEFWFSILILLKTLLPFFVGAFVLLTAISALVLHVADKLIFEKLYSWYLLLFALAFLSTYIQGTFFAGKLPALDGNTVDWSLYSDQRFVSLAIWVVCFAVVLLASRLLGAKRWRSVLCWGGCGMTLMLLMTLTVLCMTTGALRNRTIDLTTDNQMVFSSGQNYSILMMDSIDEDVFSHVLDDNPDYETGVLKDFTHYDNALSAYSLTMYSVPSFLSGEWYECQMPYDQWFSECFRNARFFRELKNRGFQINLYAPNVPYDYYSELSNHYNLNDELTSKVKMEKLQLRMVGFRYAPYDLKPIFRFDTLDFTDIRSYEHMPYDFWNANTLFEKAMNTIPATLQAENSFKFIQLDGAHVPFNQRLENGKIVLGEGQENAYSETEVCLYLLDKYIGILKDLGIYDQTVIVLMSDHGQEPLGGLGEGENPLLYRADPVFLVKGINEQHDKLISLDMPISFIELPRAFLNLLDGKSGTELFEPREDNYIRRFLPADLGNRLDYFWEYEQCGPASDPNNLKATGRIFSR